MPKRLLKRFTPTPATLREHKHLRMFGRLLHDPNLWHLNRRSAAGACAVGFFMAFVPLPIQTLLAAAAAILLRVNLPVALLTLWLNNPVTLPFMIYLAYWVGATLLGQPLQHLDFTLSAGELWASFQGIWTPFLLGCLISASIASLIGYFGVRGLWRWQVIRSIRRRRARQLKQRLAIAAGNANAAGSS